MHSIPSGQSASVAQGSTQRLSATKRLPGVPTSALSRHSGTVVPTFTVGQSASRVHGYEQDSQKLQESWNPNP